MARVLKAGVRTREVAVVKHDCGATVEFERKDVRTDMRNESYVVCPACKGTPWIDSRVLKWKKVRVR